MSDGMTTSPHDLSLASGSPTRRQSVKGLPPKYTTHLRTLLQQWIRQQKDDHGGMPGGPSLTALWSEIRANELEDAINKGVLEGQNSSGQQSLLDIDWSDWAARSWRRRDAWKQEQTDLAKRKQKDTVDRSTLRFLKRASQSDAEVRKRGRQLSVGTPAAIASLTTSTVSTPARLPSRPASIASSAKSIPQVDEFSEQLTAGLYKTMTMTTDGSSLSDEALHKWCDRVMGLQGYEPLKLEKQDEWEVVRGTLPRSSIQVVPGAFPQADQDRGPTGEAHITTFIPPLPDTTKDCVMLKPVFCLQFAPSPAPSTTASNASTVRFRDRSSGSIGSNTAWWASGKRQSEMTIRECDEQAFEIQFVPGQFALPFKQRSPASSTSDQLGTSVTSSAMESLRKSSSRSESWSDGDEATKPGNEPVNLIIGGNDDDIPTEVKEGEVGLVGGTFIVKGMSDATQRGALAKILQHILYSIHSIKIELEVLDAFGIPRETESHISNVVQRDMVKADLVRRSSMQGSRERRGFFGRLVGRDTREVLDNIFRPHRSRLCQNGTTDNPLPEARLRSSSFDSGFDASCAATNASLSSTTDPSASESLSSGNVKEKTIFPQPANTNLELLTNMRKIQISTTPGMKIPPPTLLQRADDEEKTRSGIRAPAQSGLGLLFGHDIPPTVRLDDRPSDQRSGGDVRVGLKAIRADIDTFEGWSRFQRLETLRCTTVDDPSNSDESGKPLPTICEKPQPESFVFYDHEHDASVLDIIRGLEAEMDDLAACSRPGCVATAHDHTRSWYHSDKKVVLRAEKYGSGDSDTEEPGMSLETWISCSQCDSLTKPQRISDGGACYSWGKLMELLIYTSIVRANPHCTHPPVVHLRNTGVEATVSVVSFTVLDMRLPQLQVGPNVNKRKPGKEAAEAVLDCLSNERTEAAREKVQRQLEVYNESVAKVLIHLDRLVATADTVTLDSEFKRKPEWNINEMSDKLRLLGFDIQRHQLDLEAAISQIPSSRLNDVRTKIIAHHNQMEQMLSPFFGDNKIVGSLSDVPFALPEFIGSDHHALPGGSLLVRENDPSSVIAYTLSSLAYYKELSGTKKVASEGPEGVDGVKLADQTSGWRVEVRRRDNIQDLFTLRNITKKQTDVSATPSKPPAMAVTHPMPSLELSLEQVHGHSESHNHLGNLVKSISKAASLDPILAARTDSPHFSSRNASPSLSSWHEDAPIEDEEGWGSPKRSVKRRAGLDHLLPEAVNPISRSVSGDGPSVPITPNTSAGIGTPMREDGWGSMTSNFTSALLKMGSGVGETLGSFRMKGGERSLSSMLGPLSSMSQTDNALANSGAHRLPHIVFTYSLGEKLKLSCTVYFAEAFDSLRRRCAIEKAMIESLSEVENWDASGGKSKAAFFMTKDKRFIVKELVAGWIGSDTNAMLELAPEYFRYMQSTHNKATSLVKIAGFFSVTTHDKSSGSKRNMDLLIMENLFYKHEITKTYDLKGIEGRRVAKHSVPSSGTAEAKAVNSTTLWDGDWLDSISRTPVFLYPHAKRILTEAIAMDTKFLAAQSVMDYSLLIGLDKGQRELVVGIVDSIGSYDLWKTIESKGKLLTRGGEVTVIPPGQYKERFENALNKYFLQIADGAGMSR